MHVGRWIVAFGIPALGLVASVYHESQRPPCKSFIDGPCDDPDAFVGVWWFVASLVSILVFGLVVLAFLARLVLWWVRR